MNKEACISVIGAGLAGCEAAWQAANRGVKVKLFEMKPQKMSPAHHSPGFAELVCSNSLKAERTDSAAGLLKAEMKLFSSVCIEAAYQCRVAAGGALAVDRDIFSDIITQKIRNHENIQIIEGEAASLPDGVCVVAAGPLVSDALAQNIREYIGGEYLSFFDAAAPIVTAESIDMAHAFAASRYDRGEPDYLNCPMDREEYTRFYNNLISAECIELKHFEKNMRFYEGCMPIEAMAKRGEDTMRFGPLKPVGLRDPKTGHRPWAAVQLRRENKEADIYNLVGFQTNLKFSEQKRVFSLIPALKNADFVRYGVMHRNTFIDSPKVLSTGYCLKGNEDIFFAGQITGVEGYMESAASGILAGINAANRVLGRPGIVLPKCTMMGALAGYISDQTVENFQPMGANFGIIPPIEPHIRDKRLRYDAMSRRSLEALCEILKSI